VALGFCGCDGTPAAAPVAAIDAPADAAGAPLYAFISIERWSRDGVVNTMAAPVRFRQDAIEPYFAAVDGHCAIHVGDMNAPAWPSFGTITLTGTSEGTVDMSDGYETPAAARPGWDAGDLLTVEASGGELTGFMLSGTVPAAPTLTSADMTLPGPGQIVVAGDQSFGLTWTPVDTEVFALFLGFDARHVPMHGVQCYFPGGDGTGTVPAEAIANLLPSSQVDHTNFYFSAVVRDRVAMRGVDVDLAVWNGSATRIDVAP
jgi:hypothetical protein